MGSCMTTDLVTQLANAPDTLANNGVSRIDMTHFFDDPANQVIGDARGAIVFVLGPHRTAEAHYLLAQQTRGAAALHQCRAILAQAFHDLPIDTVTGTIPVSLPHACRMTALLGFTRHGTSTDLSGRPCVVYTLERSQWAVS